MNIDWLDDLKREGADESRRFHAKVDHLLGEGDAEHVAALDFELVKSAAERLAFDMPRPLDMRQTRLLDALVERMR